MNENKSVSTSGEKSGGMIGIVVVLVLTAIIGFFVYPKITHQKEGGDSFDAPQNLEGSISEGKVLLSWSPVEGVKIDYYIIKLARGAKDTTIIIETKNADPFYTVDGLEQQGTYSISIAGATIDVEGPFSDSIEISFSTPATNIGAPTDLIGVAGVNEISVSWNPPHVSEDVVIVNYLVEYRVQGQSEFTQASTNAYPFLIDKLDGSRIYEIRVSAIGDKEAGPASESILVETRSGSGGGDHETLTFSKEPSVSVGSTSAEITWDTAKSASSQVYYGATDSMGYMTEKMNTTPRVKGHTVALNGLVPCTVYVYKVSSFDETENGIESTSGEFTTTGCKGDATVITSDKGKVTANTGVILNAKEAGRGLSVTVPAAVVTGKEVAIQALKVTKEEVKQEISKPEGKTRVGGSYVLSAIEDATTEVTSFDKPVTVSIDYQNADIAGVDLNTLKIWHYEDGLGWRQLSSCSTQVNGVGGTVTCQTTSFSVFGIFGEASSNGGGGGSSSSAGSSTTTGTIPNNVVNNIPVSTPVTIPTTDANTNSTFTKNLWYQLQDMEVKMLQKFLNLKGFKVSETGPGAPGEETDYFGVKTKDALIRFQEAYSTNILAPIGLTVGTGFFGPQTRNFINSLSN